MSRWWRAYDEAVDDPKLQQLPPALAWAWFNLCCITSQSGGNLPSIEAIAFKLRSTPEKTKRVIASLVQAGLIDIDVEGQRPHNWKGRQFKSDVTDRTAAERMRRYRNKGRNVDRNAPVTDPVTVTVPRDRADTEPEKKDAADAAPNLERELFDRGKAVLGQQAGGLIAKLLKSKKNDVALARAAIETASTKQNPREYVGAVISGGLPSGDGKRTTADQEYWGNRIPGIA